MIQSYGTSYVLDSENSSYLEPLQDLPETPELTSKLDKGIIFFDFNQAFNDVFNREVNNIIEEDAIYKSVFFNEQNVEKLKEENIKQEQESIKIVVKKKEEKEKTFPFNEGIGVKKTLEKVGLKMGENSQKIIVSEFKEKKFETKVMIKDEKGRIKMKKKRRKFKPDNIRKKIKARFHKDLRNIINTKLKKAGSNNLLELLPQQFITNITIKTNKQALDLTLEKIIKNELFEDVNQKMKNPDRDKFNKNMELMKYLSEKKEICLKAEFDKIINMKYEDILKAYFSSIEFEKSLIELYNKNKKEKIEYIEEYINKAISYVDFFKNPPIKKLEKKEKSEESLDESDEEDDSISE